MKRVILFSIAITVIFTNSVSADMWREVLPGVPGNPNANEVIRFDSQYDRGGFAGHDDERDEFVLDSWTYTGRINDVKPEKSEDDAKTTLMLETQASDETGIEISEHNEIDGFATVSESVPVEDHSNLESEAVN